MDTNKQTLIYGQIYIFIIDNGVQLKDIFDLEDNSLVSTISINQ